MGYLKRRLVPRSVRRAVHPVRTATRTAKSAVTPKSIKTHKRASYKYVHPVEVTESAIEHAVVDSVLGKPQRKTRPSGKQ
jgi:hypothetical protein